MFKRRVYNFLTDYRSFFVIFIFHHPVTRNWAENIGKRNKTRDTDSVKHDMRAWIT